MPAASHLAIHFRDDRRREADPRRRRPVDAALAVAVADLLDGDHRRHRLRSARDQQRRADPPVRRDPGDLHPLRSAILVMAISPIAMLPPFRTGNPRADGSRSRVAGFMNRLTSLGLSPSRRIDRRDAGGPAARRCGMLRLTLRDQLHQPVPARDARRRRLQQGGVEARRNRPRRAGRSARPHHQGPALQELKAVEDRIKAIQVADPEAVAQVLSLATVLDPDGRVAAFPATAPISSSPTSST